MDYHVVAWGCGVEEKCKACGSHNPSVYVETEDHRVIPMCDSCCPPERVEKDNIAESFMRVIQQKEEKMNQQAMKQMAVKVPASLQQRIKVAAVLNGVSIQDYLNQLLEENVPEMPQRV